MEKTFLSGATKISSDEGGERCVTFRIRAMCGSTSELKFPEG